MAKQRLKAVSAELRRAIRDSGQSLCQISAACGVDDGALSRFMRKRRGLTLRSVDALCRHLGLELRPSERKGR